MPGEQEVSTRAGQEAEEEEEPGQSGLLYSTLNPQCSDMMAEEGKTTQ